MRPIVFPQSNGVLEGWTKPTVADLPVFRGSDADNLPVVISCWQPSPDELTELLKGNPIWLLSIGKTHPPVMLSCTTPFVVEPPTDLIQKV